MYHRFLFVSALGAALLLTACHPARKTATPSLEVRHKGIPMPHTDSFMSRMLAAHPQYFDTLLRQNDQWHVKIIYTQIDRKANNEPRFTHHYYNVNPGLYFYPASTVKMPVAFLALQRFHELGVAGVDRNTTMVTEAPETFQTPVYNDPSSEDGRPTAAHYIKKIFLSSDNDAYNRLYEFLGPEYINRELQRMRYDSAQVIHRLSIPLSEQQNRTTNPIRFYDTSGRLLFEKAAQVYTGAYQKRQTLMGKGYMSGGKLVEKPFDFSGKNRLSLIDLHSILASVIFPRSVPEQQRFRLKDEDYGFLYRYMSMKPSESDFPQYDTSYSDAYVKFLLYGGSGRFLDSGVRIFNKPGDAYGFLTDVAYIVDEKKGVEFLLSATIYCNSDGIFNDDRYDYERVGFPFLKNLGRVFYEYELKRPRKRLPEHDILKRSGGK